MFLGNPSGNYDRILDFSHPVTGSLFFVPSMTFLDAIDPDAPLPSEGGTTQPEAEPEPDTTSDTPEPPSAAKPAYDASLKIGSLKGEKE